MCMKQCLSVLCLVLFSTGQAVRVKGANSTKNASHKPEKPQLLLSFQALVGSEDQVLNVTADQAKLMIRVEEVDITNATPADQPTDSAIVDVGRGVRHEHQRFFSETICYTFDMYPTGTMMSLSEPRAWLKRAQHLRVATNSDAAHVSTKPDNSSGKDAPTHVRMNKTQMQQMMFLEAMSDVFAAPLNVYEMTEAAGVKEVAGLNCTAWLLNQSHSLQMKEMLQAMTASADTVIQRDLPIWWFSWDAEDASEKLKMLQSLLDSSGIATMTAAFEFCVTDFGELLSTQTTYMLTYERRAPKNSTNHTKLGGSTAVQERNQSNDTTTDPSVLTLFESNSHTQLLSAPMRPKTFVQLNPTYGVTGGECVDLTQGSVGEAELDSEVNGEARLARINRETTGRWEAAPYDFWKGVKVREILPSLGTDMGPLRLPLAASRPAQPSLARAAKSQPSIPASFDARAHWPKCNSIGVIRNQGRCGSCWAVAAATVMTDRFCVAASHFLGQNASSHGSLLQLSEMQGLSLAPELLVQCDGTNHGCGGGRLDDVWLFLQSHGVPQESCAPYEHCRVPTQRSCDYDWQPVMHLQPHSDGEDKPKHDFCHGSCADGSKMKLFKVAEAYAVAKPRDVASLQRELLTHGPVEVAFFVFSDFMSYKRGVYFRTPGAFGPMGGHAVRLLGWGTEKDYENEPMDYWLIANSYSPRWGMHGLFRIRRGTNECGIESIPAAGTPDLSHLLQ